MFLHLDYVLYQQLKPKFWLIIVIFILENSQNKFY
jgi:hypothetical protein